MKVLKSNGKEIDKKLLQTCIDFLADLLNFFTNINNREIRGSSLFVVVDNVSKTLSIRLIDIASMERYPDPAQRDEGLILGVKNLL
mmetsp:Transcript_100288/g.138202  ORF Transcript_100288/g.138202 Transcript_100288/m.138202 type:complete len:86 (-) Transcript_100288:116-373(-)